MKFIELRAVPSASAPSHSPLVERERRRSLAINPGCVKILRLVTRRLGPTRPAISCHMVDGYMSATHHRKCLHLGYKATLQRIVRPPSTGSATPVMNDASSEAKNRMALATSSARPARPRGQILAQAAN